MDPEQPIILRAHRDATQHKNYHMPMRAPTCTLTRQLGVIHYKDSNRVPLSSLMAAALLQQDLRT